MRKKAKAPDDARLDRILRKFWRYDRDTQRLLILEAMYILDPEEKVWRRDATVEKIFKHFLQHPTVH